MTYNKFDLVVDFAGHVEFFYDIVAIDVDAALADIVAAYGEGVLVQWGRA